MEWLSPPRWGVLTVALPLLLAPIASATYWTSPINVHPQTYADDQFARLATPGGGAPWIIWLGADSTEGDAEIYYSRWNGDTWDAASLVNPPNTYSELSPRESEAADGGLWVAWKAPNPGTNLYLGLASHWVGTGWSLPDTIWRNGGRYDVPAVAAVSQTEAWIVRDGYPPGGGDSDIYVYHLANGQLSPEFQFAQPDSDEIIPSITLSADGSPWIVWYRINHVAPEYSLMWSSHFQANSWTTPEQIPAPAGVLAPKIAPDAAGAIWVITTGIDPSDPGVGLDSDAIWVTRNAGAGWEAPTKLHGPLVQPDSAQGHLSVAGRPGENPRAIWIRFSAFSVTRRDLMTSAWNGASWTTPELIGDIADSTRVSWPDVAEYEGRIWAAYNRYLKAPPYNENVFALHSIGYPTSAQGIEFDAHLEHGGVVLRWSLTASSEPLGLRLYRSPPHEGDIDSGPPASAHRLHEADPLEAISGEFLDAQAPPGDHDYWAEVQTRTGSTFVGPRRVHIAQSIASPPRIFSAKPNPASGSVQVSGVAGPRGTKLEVFDVQGRRVRSIKLTKTDGELFDVRWDGSSDAGNLLPSGVYFIRIRNDETGEGDSRRILFLK